MRLAGHIENISCYLAACDLLVITSEREGMSLGMLEALQAGVPVLSTPVSGATELLPDKALIQSLNPEHLAAQLLQTLSHPDALMQSLQGVFQRVQNQMSSPQLARRTLDIYQQLVSKRSPNDLNDALT